MSVSGDVLGLTCRIRGLELPEDAGLAREPRRPVEFRQERFDQLFDFRTIVYDGVLVPEEEAVVLTCPPAFNLHSQWQGAQIVDPATGRRLDFQLVELDRLLRVMVRGVTAQTSSIEIIFAGRRFELDVRDSDRHGFRDRNVLMTVSKDNEIAWIVDWAEYYARVHGVDCVLVLDNNSTSYTREMLVERLLSAPGVSLVHVVDWPFLWGPTAVNGVWDSNFGQHGAFEVCRWRFLRDAALVVNADVDELVIPRTGMNLSQFCERSSVGAANYGGRWVVGVDEERADEGGERRHRDYVHVLPRTGPLKMAKWAVKPARARSVRQWMTHRLPGLKEDPYTNDFELGHFREISTNWKWQREKTPSALADVTLDQGLLDVFRRLGWR